MIFLKSSHHKVKICAVDIVVGDVSVEIKAKMKEKIPNGPTKTMGLYSNLYVATGAKYDLTSNVSVFDGLTNGTECTVYNIDYRDAGSIRPVIIWVLFSEQ